MDTAQPQKDELEEFAHYLMDMLTQHAQELKDAINAEVKIMNSNLCHSYSQSALTKDGSK